MSSHVTNEGRELRFAFVRKLIAEGHYDATVFSICEASPLFERELPLQKGSKTRRVRPVRRGTIARYVREVRKELFETDFDGREEIRLAYERLIRAFQIAVETKNVGGMVKAQREISRLFGFGLGAAADANAVNMDQVREQVREMDLSIGDSRGQGG